MKNLTYHDAIALLGVGGAHPGGLALTKEVVKALPLGPQSKVVDIGCGTGQTASYLKKHFSCKVTAIDQHPVMLEKAKKRFDQDRVEITLYQGNAEKLPIESQSYDLALVESVTIFTDMEKSLKEYARILRPGGVLINLEMTAKSRFPEKSIKEFEALYGIKKVPLESEWRTKYQDSGFQSIQTIHEGPVLATLATPILTQDKIPDLAPSDHIDEKVYQICIHHQQLMHRFADQLKYCVFKMIKPL